MRKLLVALVILVVIVVGGILIVNYLEGRGNPKSGHVKDEALAAGRTAESLPGSDEDYYADMDYGATKNPEAMRQALDPYVKGITAEEAVKRVVRGRNNWIVWTAGNDRLWDHLTANSLGNLDLVKTVSNHPSLSYSRDNRWSYLGLVNEPCFKKGTGPRQDRYGLWLDVRDPSCPPDPFENEQKYPGVKIGARGENGLPVGSYYGYGTGIIGLRLFPNPAFDAKAAERWDAERYYTDPSYFNDPKLVKPYRVGMSCGFCHVGPNPSNPPADFENPQWANLNSNPGAQYFWIERIFKFNQDQGDFIWQLFHTSHPGALDTSLVSSDQINNPRTMNAIYNLKARLEIGRRWGNEQLAGGSVNNKQFNDYVPPITQGSLLTQLYDPNTKMVRTTHVLKDGSDAVGALGALNRVYVNIGLFSEEWLTHFIPLIGGRRITPIPIATAEKNSTYWNANTNQTPDLALFFLATAKPDYLANAPGGAAVLAAGAGQLQRGKEVFAERCARCHSSKLPERVFQTYFQPGCVGPNYMKCWNDYWQHTKTQQFKDEMKAMVMDPSFLVDNFLSNEVRVPSTLLETNACSPLATNALRGNIWDNFSSESYKNLPSVGKLLVHHPYTGQPYEIEAPGGGRGFTRPASLISLWSTAPFLQNNRLGLFDWRGTVEGRLRSFDDSIVKLLWPERREGDRQYVTRSGKSHPGVIDRTTRTSYLMIPPGYVPAELKPLTGLFDRWIPDSMGGGDIRIGPIPAGTPVNLLSNINVEGAPLTKLLWLGLKIKNDLEELGPDATDAEAKEVFAPLVKDLLAVSKCPDFVVNRGHYFGTDFLPASEGEPGLSDADKHALIAFMKTF
jgi:hypothetical protein